jgi:hypothetical protein
LKPPREKVIFSSMPFVFTPLLLIALAVALIASVGMVISGVALGMVLGVSILCFGATLLGCLLYALPSFIAYKRRHSQKEAILILNLLAGWTFFGWVAAFVWAFLDEKPEPTLESRLASLEKLKVAGKITDEEYTRLRARELGL